MSWALRVIVPFFLAACVVRTARVVHYESNYPAALPNMRRSVNGIVKRSGSSEEKEKLDALDAIMKALDDLNDAQSSLVAASRESGCEPECHEWIKGQGQLKAALESFNSVVQAFVSLKEVSPQAYAELEPSTDEIDTNLMGSLKLACDPVMRLEKAVDTAEYNAKCQDGLWPALKVEKSSFPQPGYQIWSPVHEHVACRSRTFARSDINDYEIDIGATVEQCMAACGPGCVGASLRRGHGRCYIHDSCPGGPIPKNEGKNYDTFLKTFWDVTKGTACRSTTFDKSTPDYEIQNGATIEECAAKCGDGCVGISLRSQKGQEGRCYIHDKCPGGPTKNIGEGTNYDTYMKPQ